MKKNHLLVWLLVFSISTSIAAQPPEKLPDGDTKTTTTEHNAATGTTVTTEEFRKADGTLHGFRVTTTDAFGNQQITDSITSPGGKPMRVTTVRRTAAKDTTYAEERNYDDRGKTVLEYQIREFKGDVVKVTFFRSGETKTTEEKTRRTEPGPMPPLHPDRDKDLSDNHMVEIFAGYSYLNAGSGGNGDNLSFPVGAHLAFVYMLSRKIGLVADGSYHSKKENDLRIARYFAMGGFQYMFVRIQQQREREFLLFVRLLAGLAADRQKYSLGPASYKDQAKTWAIAAGLGIAYPLSNSFFLTLLPDYIYTHFNDESQGNLRVSLGVKIHIQRHPQP